MKTAIVWFRQDLRLADNPALYQACEDCDCVIPLFIDDPDSQSVSQLGAASRVWLHHSLLSLDQDLDSRFKSRLLIRQGKPLDCLQQLIEETSATHVYWNRCYDPYSIARDKQIKASLKTDLSIETFKANLLYEPWQALKNDGEPYRVYTPFWKLLVKLGLGDQPLPAPKDISRPQKLPQSLKVSDLDLLPSLDWHSGMMSHWQVGENTANEKLFEFLDSAASNYSESRNIPSQMGTSRLSPHLHFGEISPRQMVYHAYAYLHQHPSADNGMTTFIKEIVWREFAYYLLYHFPQTLQEPLNQRFTDFPWAQDYEENLIAWQTGLTGFPIIDAGMRELWQTGWMHNRVRMIVASLLTKNLLIPWQQGEAWFRDTLIDADLASNAMGWQWVAGSGADAAPYFRIFNPVLQSQKFDPKGQYIKHWVPELTGLDEKQIHLPSSKLKNYPAPIVDLKASRERALAIFKRIK